MNVTGFDLQGHRGARGLAPENTLPSFELALDAGASTIETDLRLTRDGQIVLFHDECVSARLCAPAPSADMLVASLTLEELRRFRVAHNPDPRRFPDQQPTIAPVAQLFAHAHGVDPFAMPTLVDFIEFVEAYAGPLGAQAGKPAPKRQRAARLRFDLELKHVPFHPEFQAHSFDGQAAGLLEQQVVAAVGAAGVIERTIVRSFDHRAVRAIKDLEPRLTTAVLMGHTAPVDPGQIAKAALAEIYCPDYHFLDEHLVDRAHAQGIKVVPWTVNDAGAWERLLAWGVDGMTTDYPDRLAAYLAQRGIEVL